MTLKFSRIHRLHGLKAFSSGQMTAFGFFRAVISRVVTTIWSYLQRGYKAVLHCTVNTGQAFSTLRTIRVLGTN